MATNIPNPNATTLIAFHLNNRESDRKQYLLAQGVNVKGEDIPKYIRIK